MMTMEGSLQNLKLHGLRGRSSCARMWPYRSYVENALSSTLSIYSTVIAIVFREYNAAFLCHCRFPLIL